MLGKPLSGIKQFFENRYLLFTLIRRDVAARFVGSYAGLIWGIVHPLVLLAVYSLVFVHILRVKMGPGVQQNFAEFLFCGLWAWIAFQEGIMTGTRSVMGNPGLVKRMMFPIEVLVPSAVLSALALQLMGFAVFFLYLLVFGRIPVFGVFRLGLVLVPLALQILFSVGLGWILSALQVFIRDTVQFVSAIITVWFFLTPIIYPMDIVPESLRFLLYVNPWTHLVAMYRSVVFDGRIALNWGTVYVCVLAGAAFVAGGYVFGKLKPEFADVL